MTRISKVSKNNFRSADADQSVTAARCPERGQLKSEFSSPLYEKHTKGPADFSARVNFHLAPDGAQLKIERVAQRVSI